MLDDDTKELRRLRELLTKEGFNIITASDSPTAFKLSHQIHFDYILAKASSFPFTSGLQMFSEENQSTNNLSNKQNKEL